MSADVPSAQAWFCSSRWPSGWSCCASREQGGVARCRESSGPIAWQGRWRRTRLSILILLSQLTYKIELIYMYSWRSEWRLLWWPTMLDSWPLPAPLSATRFANIPLVSFQLLSGYMNSAPLTCAPSIGKSIGRVADACPWTLAIAKVARIRCLFRGVA